MSKQFAIIGMGRFGSSVAGALHEAGFEVLAIDKNEARIQEHAHDVTYAVTADTTDQQSLRELGIRNMDVVVVAIGDDIQASILTVLVLKELGVKHIVAKALTARHATVLTKVGADQVVFPERETGLRIAKNLITPNVLDFIELAEDYSIEEIIAPSFMEGKSLREMDIRAKYQLSVIAIHNEGKMNISPLPDNIIKRNDVFVVLGEKRHLEKFESESQAVLV